MPSPEQIDAFLRLGVAGVVTVGLIAYALGFVRPGRLVDKDKADAEARHERIENRLVAERDTAIALAQSYADQFERALDIIEGRAKPT